MSKFLNKYFFLIVDIAVLTVCGICSFLLFYPVYYMLANILVVISYSLFAVAITVTILYAFRVYRFLWEYADAKEYAYAIIGIVVSTAALIVSHLLSSSSISMRVIYYYSTFSLHYILISRFLLKYITSRRQKAKGINAHSNVMIIGAGVAGAMIMHEYLSYPQLGTPRVFIDDDKQKQGMTVNGIKIYGGREMIYDAVRRFNINEIIIAMPSAKKEVIRDIVRICNKTKCHIKTMPGIYQIIDDTVALSQLQEVNISDLLGRDQVKLDISEVLKYIKNKVVMVTGGGGSIGSELCRQIIMMQPAKLIILDIYENSTYDLQMELKHAYPNADMEVIIASVRDQKRMEAIFEKYHPYVVFHAAAHKHVPLMEFNAQEAIKNNVFGTFNVAMCADKFGTKRFVMISTDKAVNPTNVMGASKRIAELIIQAFASMSKTEFVAVRFGNVLGSNGSVIPLFKRQIAEGGPVTVTHPKITRYFMTIPEAVQLVLQAGAIAKGGEVFVLDMGEPVEIVELAKEMIRLSGYEPDEDIKIVYTGLRPGEKLYEELLLSEENVTATGVDKIHVDKPKFLPMDELKAILEKLHYLAENNMKDDMINYMHEILPNYKVNTEYNKEIDGANG